MMTQPRPAVSITLPAQEARSALVYPPALDASSTLSLLSEQQIFPAVAERFRLNRHHGYAGVDLFSVLVAWYSTQRSTSLRDFIAECRSSSVALAALCGRIRWPSQGSVSRMLNQLSQSQSEAFVGWVLNDAFEPIEHETHPDSVWHCRLNEAWHLFDFDPMVEALRRRQLVDVPELPPGQRRGEGKEGYLGRKRGQIIQSLSLLAVAGTGQWLGVWGDLGNANTSEQLAKAVEVASSWANRRKIPLQRCIMRYDGGVAQGTMGFKLCQAAGLSYVTRLNSQRVLEGKHRKQVESVLARAQWLPVADSGSGPKREGAEIGCLSLADEHGEMCMTRVVVTRFAIDPRSRKRHGAGLNRGGWHYECFATDLDPAHWPAADIVTLYYDRSSIENRIQQGDRELTLNRKASNRLAGQTLAVGIALFVWNLQFWHGCQEQYRVDGDAFRKGTGRSCSPPSCSESSSQQGETRALSQPSEPEPTAKEKAKQLLRERAERLLGELDLAARLAVLPTTRWRCEAGSLPTCTAGANLHLTGVYRSGRGDGYRIVMRPSAESCRKCRFAPSCLAADGRRCSSEQLPQLSIQITAEQHRRLTEERAELPAVPPPETTPETRLPQWKPTTSSDGGVPAQRPLINAAYLRREARKSLRLLAATVDITLGPVIESMHPAFHKDANSRSHQRQSWKTKLNYYALPPGSKAELRRLCSTPFLDLRQQDRNM